MINRKTKFLSFHTKEFDLGAALLEIEVVKAEQIRSTKGKVKPVQFPKPSSLKIKSVFNPDKAPLSAWLEECGTGKAISNRLSGADDKPKDHPLYEFLKELDIELSVKVLPHPFVAISKIDGYRKAGFFSWEDQPPRLRAMVEQRMYDRPSVLAVLLGLSEAPNMLPTRSFAQSKAKW